VGDVDCMSLAQDRDKLCAFMNTVMNFRVPKKAGNLNYLNSCPMDLVTSPFLLFVSSYPYCGN
jgi:hypothetical protein